MEVAHEFISDARVLPDLIGRTWDAGYVPSFVTAQKKPTGTVIYKVRLHADGGIRFNSEPLSRDHYIRTATANPHRGIGVQCPVTRDPELLLFGLDLDDNGPEYLTLLASVVNKPAPTRVGGKGCAMFVTMRREYDRAILEKAGIDGKNLGPPGHELECMGLTAMQHLVLPPSRYGNIENIETGDPVYYRWVPFPSRSPLKRDTIALWDIRVDSLPTITEHHLMEMRLHMHKGNSALAKLILGDPWHGPGDGAFRDRIREAVHFMVMEDLPDDYIELRIEQIAWDLLDVQPNTQWGEDCKPLIDDVRGMSRGSRKRPSNPVVGRGGAKVPLVRKMYDWICMLYPERDVRMFGGEVRFWDDTAWVALQANTLVRLMLEKYPEATPKQAMEVANSWLTAEHDDAPYARPNMVYTLSGVVDAITGECRPLMKEDYLAHPMQAKYDPKATAPNWTRHIAAMFRPPPLAAVEPEDYDDEHRLALQTFEEFMGYCMARNYQFQKALFIIGPPNCGKGTLWRVLKKLFPENSVCGMPMTALDSDDIRHSMVGKLVNIGSEVGRKNQDVDQAFNQITAHEEVTVWKKYSNKYYTRLDARLVFDGNQVPATADVTGAFKRRSLLLLCHELDKNVTIMSSDAYDATLLPELPGILNRLIQAYGRLLRRRGFEPPKYTDAANENTRINANPVAAWASEHLEKDDSFFMSNGQLYAHFKEWLEINGHYRVDNVRWGMKMSEFGWPPVAVKVGGKKVLGRRARLLEYFNPNGVQF